MSIFKRSNGTSTSVSRSSMQKVSSELFFYGRITREEAEKILTMNGLGEGLYILRESISPLGNYSISLCHKKAMHHYKIEKQTDGKYMIADGPKFASPLDLMEHYKNNPDGLVTTPRTPCNRNANQQAVAFRGMTYSDLEKEMNARAHAIKNVDMDKVFGSMRDHFIRMVARDLHLKQPWFHRKLSREHAETRLKKEGIKQGKFLVRQRDDKKTYALSVSTGVSSDTKHYFININGEEKFSIEDGPKFECLIMLIDHYHNKQDGLNCKLTVPCPNSSCSDGDLLRYMKTCNEHLLGTPGSDSPPNTPAPVPFKKNPRRISMPVPPIPCCDVEDPPEISQPAPDINDDVPDSEIYMELRRKDMNFELEPNRLTLKDKLGSGQFGSVVKGLCKLGGQKIPVAIKTLKNEQILPGVEPELFKEAKLMQELHHKHIVGMIGICKADNIMLVLELAPLGPLNKYLSKNKDMTQSEIICLMLQVAKGMAYLENKKFVHRDLAARNVLMVNRKFAKISDFGMSKALGRENNYYEANSPGKWPLKWYALECILYWKFDSKSDVWSYGVTMWEALTYGGKPYQSKGSQEIVEFLQNGHRLQKPPGSGEMAYKIMLNCWKEKKEDRPNFAEVVQKMELLHQNLLLNPDDP